MRESEIPAIRTLELFREMSDDNFAELMRGAYVQHFPPNMELIVEGDPCDFLHIIVDGTVELYANWNDRETALAILGDNATFILAAAIRDAPNLMSARTLERSQIIMIPSVDVRNIFKVDHNFARAVVMELSLCYRGVIKGVKGLKLRTSVERLANYLLKWQRKTGGATSFALPIEKRRLASLLGMTPENLSRSIKALRPYGVAVSGDKVEITNQADLESLAKPTPLIDGSRT